MDLPALGGKPGTGREPVVHPGVAVVADPSLGNRTVHEREVGGLVLRLAQTVVEQRIANLPRDQVHYISVEDSRYSLPREEREFYRFLKKD